MKVGIITITSGENYGNRLQNYAVEKVLNNLGIQAETIKNYGENREDCLKKIKKYIKNVAKKTIFLKKYKYQNIRSKNFKKFNRKFIKSSKFSVANTNIPSNLNDSYDFFICGSDQIWNSNFKENAYVNFLGFANKEKTIAFAPSFGSSSIKNDRINEYSSYLRNIKYLSVREEAGKKIVEELTGRNDVEVLVDPTMLLSADEWDKVSKKPKQLKTDRYILNYFLGELSEHRKKEIERIAKENSCEIINILDKNSGFYETGPSEFLYLEKNAFLICTDSFHSCVFAIIYNRPFVVFDREDKNISMNSRIETLISKFELENRKFDGEITEKNLEHDYTNAYKILEKEKEKSYRFLLKALNLEEKIEGKKSN